VVDVADDVALAESRLVARPLVEPHVTQGHRRDAIVVHDQARLCAWSASLGVTHALAVTSSAVRTAFSVMACSAGRRRSRAVIPNPRKAACTLTASRGSTERTHPSTRTQARAHGSRCCEGPRRWAGRCRARAPGWGVCAQKDARPMFRVGPQKCRYTSAGRCGDCSSLRTMTSSDRLPPAGARRFSMPRALNAQADQGCRADDALCSEQQARAPLGSTARTGGRCS